MDTLKYFIYARRSTDEVKQAMSIEDQINELLDRFDTSNVVEVINENGSAFKPRNRPEFANMLSRIKKGEADGIIAWSPDRLSRNSTDSAELFALLDSKVLKDIKFASGSFNNDAEGRMVLGITFAQTKYYSEKLGVDVKRALNQKCKRKQFPGNARIGYKNIRNEKDEGIIVPDEERFHLIQKAWNMALSQGHTIADIYKIATKEWSLTMRATRKKPEKLVSRSTNAKNVEQP